MVTCADAIKKVFLDKGGVLTTKQVIDEVNKRYTQKPWKDITISTHCMGCSVNHSSSKWYSFQKFLFTVGRGRMRLYNPEKDDIINELITSKPCNRASYAKRGRFNIISTNKNELLANITDYYNKTKDIGNEFGGPSVYFHIECVKAGKENYLSNRHIEMLYATLTSWGMHKMGNPKKTKAKLVNFDIFKDSILSFEKDLNWLKQSNLNSIEKNKDTIKNIFMKLKVSISESMLVANSKTMHHLLWDLVPPIDRQYTVRFFLQNKIDFRYTTGKNNGKYRGVQVPISKDEQFDFFWNIIMETKNIIGSREFNSLNVKISTNFLSTSKPKIVDNLIMAFVKNN